MLLYRFFKKLDGGKKIYIPSKAIDMFGEEYYMEIYEDCIKLIPKNIKENNLKEE